MPAKPREIPLKGTSSNATLISTNNSMYGVTEVEAALTQIALAGDNATKAAKLTGHAPSTLQDWRNRYRDRYDEIRRELAPQIESTIIEEARATALLAAEAERAGIQATISSINNGTIKDPSSAAKNMSLVKAVNVDKFLLLENRPTSISTHVGTDELLRKLTAGGYIDSTAQELPDEDRPTPGLLP